MWIRSQNKCQLFNANVIWIEDNNIFCSYNGTKKDSGSVGRYETDERAIEIMNTMQSCIKCILDGESHVFEMPEK